MGESINIKADNFREFASYLIKAIIWGLVILFIAEKFVTGPFWNLAIGVLVLGALIAVSGIYENTIKQIHRLNYFSSKGWIYRFISGRPLKISLWICWALFSSFWMLIQFHAFTTLDWIAFFILIPLFFATYGVARPILTKELKPYLVTSMTLVWSRRITSILMLVIYAILILIFSDMPNYSSIEEAISSQKSLISDVTLGTLFGETSHFLAYLNGYKVYAIGHLSKPDSLLIIAVFAVANLAIFYNVCLILSGLLIPRSEYRRIFIPLSDQEQPLSISQSRITTIVATTTFITVFIYFSVFVYLELWVKNSNAFSWTREKTESSITLMVEVIGGEKFNAGTISQANDLRSKILQESTLSLVFMDSMIDSAFLQMENNVDLYLDWYYSLGGEYMQILKLGMGDAETYMVKKLEETLTQGDAFNAIEKTIDSLFAVTEEAQQIFKYELDSLLEANRLNTVGENIVIAHQLSIGEIYNIPAHHELAGIKTRLSVAGSTGLAAGLLSKVVAKKISAKILGKSMFKLAVKSVSKIATKVVGSAATGAATGAAAGSVVPVVGNFVGGVIGVAGGLVAGFAVDYAIIKVDEAKYRDEFKREIISAINEEHLKFKNSLKTTGSDRES